jgi:hypothetical protein
MPYVRRDGNGSIISTYRRPPGDIAPEFMPEDDPEIAAFRTPKAVPEIPTLEDVTRVLLAKAGVTRADLEAAKADRGKPL